LDAFIRTYLLRFVPEVKKKKKKKKKKEKKKKKKENEEDKEENRIIPSNVFTACIL
jgi:hypothetical protein